MKHIPPYGSIDPNAPYVDRDVPGAVVGSKIPAKFPNMVIGEIVDVIAKSGITPDDVLQLSAAIRSQKMNYFVPGGTSSAMTITPSPAFAALADLVGVPLKLKNGGVVNPGALTVNVNGLGAVAVKQLDGSALVAGVLPANCIFEIIYNGTDFLLTAGGAQHSSITQRLQNFIIIADQKAAGTKGGTFTSGAWRTRDLNTVIADPQNMVGAGIVTLASNQVTLGAGAWLIEASAPAIAVDGHKTRLFNVTDNAVITYGTTEQCTAVGTTDQVQTRSQLVVKLTLAAAKVLQLQHVCITTGATSGFGEASDYGLGANNGTEIYSIFRAQKLD